MNINKRDAQDALGIAGAGNVKAIANLMLRMLSNAIDLNLKFLADDEATKWVNRSLLIISNEPKDGAYPFSLRPNVYEETARLYRMAYTLAERNAPMSYAPLTLAAQVLANITCNDSYKEETQWGPGLVKKGRASELGMAVPDTVYIYVDGIQIGYDWYEIAQKECKAALKEYSHA